MGTWNETEFGNDFALDWLGSAHLQSDDTFLAYVQSTLQKVLNAWDGDAKIASNAMAAIAVVSMLSSEPIGQCPKHVKNLISRCIFSPNRGLLELSIAALELICYSVNSELRQLWAEAGRLSSWLVRAEKLSNRLSAALQLGIPNRVSKKPSTPRTLHKMLEHFKNEPSTVIREKIYQKFSSLKDVNACVCETDFERPLYLAAVSGLLEETQLLIGRGAQVNQKNSRGQSPFEAACVGGHFNVAELLLANDATVFEELDSTNNYSVKGDFADRAKQIGADLLPIGYRYCPALFFVARSGSVASLKYLLGLGAAVNQLASDLRNIAHFACENNNVPILKYLHDSGFDVNKPIGTLGRQPLETAIWSNAIESVEFLLTVGAKPNWVGSDLWSLYEAAQTPIDIARSLDSSDGKEMENILLSYGAKTLSELQATKP
jgi:ankyrin repeat protein